MRAIQITDTPVCMQLKNAVTGAEAQYPTSVCFHLSQGVLHVRFVAEESAFYTPYEGYNQPLYEGCVCELFFGDRLNYYEIEVAPNGAVFFAKITFDPVEDDIGGRALLPLPPKAEAIKGERGYEVSLSLPLKELGLHTPFCLNAYRIEQKNKESEPVLLALSPTYRPFFHTPAAFVEVEAE